MTSTDKRARRRMHAAALNLGALLWLPVAAHAASTPAAPNRTAPPIAAPAVSTAPATPMPLLQGGVVLPLYPPGSPRLNAARVHEAEQLTMTKGVPGRVQSVVNVHNPSVEVHPADPLHNTGAAIIIAAGGAHQALNIGTEGADVASFLYNHGVATVLLRNRLRRDGYEPPTDGVADALQAVRVVRGVAATYGIDPQRIGLMGFSAGAELAAGAALEFPAFAAGGAPSARPDFVVLVYPGPSPFARGATPTIPPNVPPSFVVTAGTDDQVHALWADEWVHAMLAAGVPNVEFHVYGRGGHGGGLKDRGGLPFGTWQDRFIDWFRDLGFLQTPAAAQRAAPNTPPRGASTPAAAPVQRDAPRP